MASSCGPGVSQIALKCVLIDWRGVGLFTGKCAHKKQRLLLEPLYNMQQKWTQPVSKINVRWDCCELFIYWFLIVCTFNTHSGLFFVANRCHIIVACSEIWTHCARILLPGRFVPCSGQSHAVLAERSEQRTQKSEWSGACCWSLLDKPIWNHKEQHEQREFA